MEWAALSVTHVKWYYLGLFHLMLPFRNLAILINEKKGLPTVVTNIWIISNYTGTQFNCRGGSLSLYQALSLSGKHKQCKSPQFRLPRDLIGLLTCCLMWTKQGILIAGDRCSCGYTDAARWVSPTCIHHHSPIKPGQWCEYAINHHFYKTHFRTTLKAGGGKPVFFNLIFILSYSWLTVLCFKKLFSLGKILVGVLFVLRHSIFGSLYSCPLSITLPSSQLLTKCELLIWQISSLQYRKGGLHVSKACHSRRLPEDPPPTVLLSFDLSAENRPRHDTSVAPDSWQHLLGQGPC